MRILLYIVCFLSIWARTGHSPTRRVVYPTVGFHYMVAGGASKQLSFNIVHSTFTPQTLFTLSMLEARCNTPNLGCSFSGFTLCALTPTAVLFATDTFQVADFHFLTMLTPASPFFSMNCLISSRSSMSSSSSPAFGFFGAIG